MATIITPGSDNSGNGSAGWIIAIVILLLVMVFGIYFLPRLLAPSTTVVNPVTQTTPADTSGGNTGNTTTVNPAPATTNSIYTSSTTVKNGTVNSTTTITH